MEDRAITPAYRRYALSLLLAVNLLNYIDRQTLSVLAPVLKVEYHWSNQDFALVVIAFRLRLISPRSWSKNWIPRMRG